MGLSYSISRAQCGHCGSLSVRAKYGGKDGESISQQAARNSLTQIRIKYSSYYHMICVVTSLPSQSPDVRGPKWEMTALKQVLVI